MNHFITLALQGPMMSHTQPRDINVRDGSWGSKGRQQLQTFNASVMVRRLNNIR